MCDAVLINANQLENNPNGTAAYLEETGLPYLVDPMLSRLQIPAWWRNEQGEVKRNYARLASRYSQRTDVRMAEAPLVDSVERERDWRQIASNIVSYQRDRLSEQVDLFHPEGLQPQAIVAPALVASGDAEDRINRTLAQEACESAGEPVMVPLVLPRERVREPGEVSSALAAVLVEGARGYLVWTPGVTEELLLTDPDTFAGLLEIVSKLAASGSPVVHLQGSYVTEALHELGIAAVVHHLGWVDKGEPTGEQRGAIRSTRTYVPGVRHCVRFPEAAALGRHLGEHDYLDRYCSCRFCEGVFSRGQHPLDLLLEDRLVQPTNTRRTPTSRAIVANTWHYLSARREEVEAFGSERVIDVVSRDIARASRLSGSAGALEHLASVLRSA
jgi:hypothetical protein